MAIRIGKNAYFGKEVSIECNADIGDNVLIANRVAFVGRRDHHFRQVGVPVRFAQWIGEMDFPPDWRCEKVEVSDDVWIGYGAILLTGIHIGRGAVIAAGAVVTADVEAYVVAAGNPAVKVGLRFENATIEGVHEEMMAENVYSFSERRVARKARRRDQYE